MAEQPENTPQRSWARRTVLGGAGLAVAGTLAGCTPGEDGDSSEGAEGEQAPRLAKPEIISTAEWEAVDPAYYIQTFYERPSYLVIHHTTTPNVTDGSREAAIDLAQMVQAGHLNNEWGDTGQQFTMSRGGHALEGRHGSLYTLDQGDRFMLGIHAVGFNAYALGIECEGRYMKSPPPQSLYAGLVKLAAYICQQYDLPPSRIIGHRDIVKTSCCGDAFYVKLPILREDVRLSLESGEYHITEGFGADNLNDDSDVELE